MYIVVGTVTRQDMNIYNSAVIFRRKTKILYIINALYGAGIETIFVLEKKKVFWISME